ncbi:nitrite reductase small subunit NirD [Streptomyces sp. NPDC048484]|uniref:nitrite reductase small subunit NirD n=1 Tax=Streptomyces sp. NPDC048484 TaxID=3155146 RepID=UPI00341417AE
MTLATETTTLRIQLQLDGPNSTAGTASSTASSASSASSADDWFTVCDLTVLTPGRGVAALLPDGRQVALFLDRTGRMYAIDNRDPFSGAAVLSRGLTGSHQGRPFVASPLLKQRFDLESGRCLDDDTVTVPTYEVRAR